MLDKENFSSFINKEERIKHAIKYYIESVLSDKRTLSAKANFLEMEVSDLSKLLNLRTLPSLHRILEIERKLQVEILIENLPKEEISLDTLNHRISFIEKQLEHLGKKESHENVKNLTELKFPESLYRQILNDPIYKDSINPLLDAIKDYLKPTAEKEKLKYEERKDGSQYISINLTDKKRISGGFHIMFIRYYPNKSKLHLEFIVQNEQFRSQIETINKQFRLINNDFPELKKGNTYTTSIPRKKAGYAYEEHGRPSLTFFKSLTTDDIQQIAYLAKEVYNEQSKSVE
ncbi:MAG: hypothetical protein IPH20_13485 [Bacteroidales bacterium]|nr:hypothetical protein [Bacteroidales bacterium]